MRKLTAIVLAVLFLVPLLAGPAQAWGRGGGWHGGGRYGGGSHGGGWHGGGWGWGGFALGLGIGALATSPYWYPPAYAYPAYPYAYPAYPYAYPTYPYPAYSYPAYAPPPDPGAGGQADPSTSLSYGNSPANPPQPSAQGAAPTSGQNCETVTVQAHNETRTLQNGQSATVWIPAHSQQICR